MDTHKLIIAERSTIKDALKRMDEAGQKILFVVSASNRLSGTVTDGDIRRAILHGIGLRQPVRRIMNKQPVSLGQGFSREQAKRIMLEKGIECIPILGKRQEVLSAVRWIDLFQDRPDKRKRFNLPIVIMAGGEGTRLSPFTSILPKPLIPINGKPIIEIIMEKFAAFGCRAFLLSVNYKANILKAYFSETCFQRNISYIQEEKPLGTIGSVRLAKKLLKQTFFVTNCDILIEGDYHDIVRFHREQGNMITVVVSMKHYTIPYGICEIHNGGTLKGIREKPEYDMMVNTGMYLLEKEVIRDIPEQAPYNMTDLINDYVQQGKKVGVYPVSEQSWIDMGEFQELQKMLKKYEVTG